jgi:hypothetical protein
MQSCAVACRVQRRHGRKTVHPEHRTARTFDKALRGGLPRPTADRVQAFRGSNEPCDGCGDPISHGDLLLRVIVRPNVSFWFHDCCYEAWLTFVK